MIDEEIKEDKFNMSAKKSKSSIGVEEDIQ